MDNKKELLKNTAIIFVGRICTQFISFILLPIYTYYLNTYEYGLIDLIQTYIALFVPVIALRLDSSVFRFLIDERGNEENKKIVISNVIIALFVQVIVFLILYMCIARYIILDYYWLVIFNILFMTISSVFIQIPRGMGDNVGYSITCCITGLIAITLNIVLVVISRLAGRGVLISSGLANMIGCIFIIFRCKLYKYVEIRAFDKSKVKQLLKYSLPMVPDGLSWWVINASDRTIVSTFINVGANGIYAVSSKFSNILSSFFSVINMSWQESASIHINDDDRDNFFSDIINNILNIFVVLCLGILVCIPLAFEILIGEDYFESLKYIPILLLSNIFNVLGGMFGGIYISKKMTKEVAKTTIFAAAINIIINLIFVKKFGLYAAAISTLIAYFSIFIYRYIGSKEFVKITFSKNIIICSIIMYVISTTLFYINNFIGNFINIIIVVIYAFITNRNNLLLLFNMLKNKLNK